ncbi:mini-chromosome maintenance complex-binding protein isoform X2 [Phymastichus coffea]|uniref:mini-chromosome maintenance complex-binding protein isoform X2 n=1 Tax=Phymastichus coffea TaxID=108790 RepID=UPI00273BF9E4|nr:mini-chromosome maintenance complex-binding protein isoform X2 [Phymastichus coffea]
MALKPTDWTVDYFLKNKSDCMKDLENADALNEIPSLNSTNLDYLNDGQLVHFRGMIQDMYNPEYFLQNYQVINEQTGKSSIRSGLLIDRAHCESYEKIEFNSDSTVKSERQVWIVISIPGLNDWAKESLKNRMPIDVQSTKSNVNKSSKRALDDSEEPMDCSEPQQKKEKALDNNAEVGSLYSMDKESKKPQLVSKDYLLNFPIPDKDGKICIVKVYQNMPYKLNQVIDIIGFLSLDPTLSEIYDSPNMTELEQQIHHPPASIVPRLHAIKIIDEKSKYIVEQTNIFSKAECIREDLRRVLSQILFGDQVAADYLICHLISSVYLRQPSLSLGAFSINITNFPMKYKDFSKDLYEILRQIVEKSHLIDMTLGNLNNMCFLPKKDYECDRLTSGILQLSKNTHLIIDETGLTAGQVTACGRQNYNTINDLIIFQKLPYDFKYYTMDHETDIPVLILSESKSFVSCRQQIVLKPDPETVKLYPHVLEAAKQYLKDENRLTDIRQYISTLKHAKFDFTEETSEVIQDDFVRLRHIYKKFTPDDLHSLMVLSRLMSLSHGLNVLKPDMWKRSLKLEMERLNRLSRRR